MLFPGVFLFTWAGFLMHECWHKYVPNIPNRLYFNLFSWMLITDPQVYRLVHGDHHAEVNTYRDIEFHPLGRINNRILRSIYNLCEIVFGIAFLIICASFTVPRDVRYKKKYRLWKMIMSVIVWILFLGCLGFASHYVFGVSYESIALLYAVTIWFNSVVLHHSQMIEHGNLIVEGDLKRRNLVTRNLKPAGIFEKLFLFLTHNDSREHVLHHTLARVYSRPFPEKIPLPEKANNITIKDYIKILGQMAAGQECDK
jgi:fatty acid desaturase